MRAADLKSLIKREPFEPVRIGLTDGRAVVVRHPDQIVVSERHLYVGLAEMGMSPPLATPDNAADIPQDFILVNLLHVVSIEPASNGRKRRKR